jgi:signal transduction histidine kinase
MTELVEARQDVREIAERLLTLQEDERQRIAAELHDSTAQHLVAVGLNLLRVEQFLPQRDGQRILDEIDRSLELALKELRIFTYLLHPPGIETDGLVSTAQAFADGFSKRTNLQTTCRIDARADVLPADLKRALFRIIQEGLANVHRHADASEVVVDLRLTSEDVILCVADNGRGMRRPRSEMSAGKPSLGVGIPGMRIRLHQFGGSLRIRSGRQGTIVRARVGCPPATPAPIGLSSRP